MKKEKKGRRLLQSRYEDRTQYLHRVERGTLDEEGVGGRVAKIFWNECLRHCVYWQFFLLASEGSWDSPIGGRNFWRAPRCPRNVGIITLILVQERAPMQPSQNIRLEWLEARLEVVDQFWTLDRIAGS